MNIDVWAWQEVNIKRSKVSQEHKLYYRAKEWFGMATAITAHSIHYKTQTTSQRVGTSIIVRGALSHILGNKGVDPSGLGRWCWVQIRGKENRLVRVVSFYAPHLPSGPESLGGQHRHHFNSVGRNEQPPCTVK
jgi:hypothetical protein